MTETIPHKHIKEGHEFTIELPENESTGYTWDAETTCGLKIIKDKYKPNKRIGEAGKCIWIIKATGKGLQEFSAYYERDWNPHYAGEYHCVVKVF